MDVNNCQSLVLIGEYDCKMNKKNIENQLSELERNM